MPKARRKRVTTRGRRQKKRRNQRGGAKFVRKPRLVDKIAEGAAMFLSGPSPSFAKLGVLLGKQAFKGIKDNVQRYRSKR